VHNALYDLNKSILKNVLLFKIIFFHSLQVKIIFSLHIDPYEATALSFSCILTCLIFACQRRTPRGS